MNGIKCKKIGIIGGTFDPIHYGHLLIAQSAAEEFALDKVIFLPTGKSPHKSEAKVTSPDLRCRMVQAAIAGQKSFQLSRMEADNTEINYTYRTLQSLTGKHPDAHFYFIMGEDSLDSFPKWRNPQEICTMATILVAVRNDVGANVEEKISAIRERYHGDIHMLHAPNFSVSSREIRERIRNGKAVHYMLPEAVEALIQKNALYGNADPISAS